MEFYTAFNESRPVRLSEEARRFAWESLQGRYGDEAMESHHVDMDSVERFELLSEQKRYDAAIMKIAEEAPLRVCPHESVSGAATLGCAIEHRVPAYYMGRHVTDGISHLTVDFHTVLYRGVDYLDGKIAQRLLDPTLTERQRGELEGMANVIAAMRVYHNRYMDLLLREKPENAENLKNVPFSPAKTFKEAVQSLWFTFSFIRLCGNWPGIGRLDEMLRPFLERDLSEGAITLDEARELLAGFFIKGCEWIRSNAPAGTGGRTALSKYRPGRHRRERT